MDSPAPVAPPGPVGRDRVLLVLALVALAAALAFPFAPVEQPRVEYRWPQPGNSGPMALPLMPYQPVQLDASATCGALRSFRDDPGFPGRPAFTTVPQEYDPEAAGLPGMVVGLTGDALTVRTGGVTLDPVPLPAGDCTVTLSSTPERTTVAVDGRTVLVRDGDVRPAVVGVFNDAAVADGLSVTFVADTRFQTSISPLKAGIAAVGVLAVLGMHVRLARRERSRRVRLLPRGSLRPRAPDVLVTAVLAAWWVIGPVSVDDGYIAGIVRSRASNGLVGNVYRWLNAPEAPFSWFYDLYAVWAKVSDATVWLRLPSILLALATWFLLSRLLLPRLLPRRPRGMLWLGAAATLAWFLSFVPVLRPEPWVALGLVATAVAAERVVATRRLTPLAVGLLIAGATTAITPGGLMAFAPFVAAGVPVLRTLRARSRELGTVTVVVVALAAPAAASFLMVYDQSLAGMLEATRVRTLIGGGQPWYEEYTRYSGLLGPGDILGMLARRLPVLLTLLAAPALLWVVARRGTGLATGAVRRAVVTFLLALAAMTATPTKWTSHFGDVAGLGAVLLTAGLVAGSAAVLRRRSSSPVPALAGLAAVTVAGSLVLAGWNNWPFVSNWWNLTWSTVAPFVAGVPLAALWLVAGLVLLAVLVARAGWLASAGRAPVAPRWQPSPSTAAVLLVVVGVALSVLTFARTSWSHRDDYTLASDAAATVGGRPCGLGERLSVEPEPLAGMLPSDGGARGVVERPMDVAGTPALPAVVSGTAGHTDWYRLDAAQIDRSLPVVMTAAGTLRPGESVTAEFADAAKRTVGEEPIAPDDDGATPTDRRVLAPEGARLVRLVVDAPDDAAVGIDPITVGPEQAGGATVSLPRVPRLARLSTYLPNGTPTVLDWPIAFAFPCLTPAPLPDGTASIPEWRIGPPQNEESAGITYAPAYGGPFAGSRLLATEKRMATYVDGDPMRDAVQVYRWYVLASSPGVPSRVTTDTVSGLAREGRATVPGLDPPG